jgi:AcrR family transcriptional regulator
MLAPQRSHAGVEETRARILSAAREVFERNGTRGTTTREVAERAGVNEATLFRHFGSKAALLHAMREECSAVPQFLELINQLDGSDMRGDLLRLAHAGVEKMANQRALMCISLAEDAVDGTGLDDSTSPEWRGPSVILQLLADYFAQRAAEGRVVGEPAIMARVLMGMLFQFVVAQRLWSGVVVDHTTVDYLVDVFLSGVQKGSKSC